MKFIKLALLIFLSNNVSAQMKNSNDNFSLQNGSLNLSLNQANQDIDQKQYIGNYKKGKVHGYQEYENYIYNAYTDEFEFLNGNKNQILQKHNGLKIEFIDGQTFKYLTFKDHKDNYQQGFLELITNSDKKYNLYKQTNISISESINKNSYSGSNNSKKYKTTTQYLLDDSNDIIYFPKNTKKLSQIFQVDVDAILKANNLNLKKESDIIKLFEIINK